MQKKEKQSEKEEQLPLNEDILQPYDKESTVLSFSWELTREEGTDEGEKNETTDLEENVCEEKGESRDLLVICMTNTSIAVVGTRGCEACEGTGCTVNDIVVMAETRTVTFGELKGFTSRFLFVSKFTIFNPVYRS